MPEYCEICQEAVVNGSYVEDFDFDTCSCPEQQSLRAERGLATIPIDDDPELPLEGLKARKKGVGRRREQCYA